MKTDHPRDIATADALRQRAVNPKQKVVMARFAEIAMTDSVARF